jgi:glycosyltransferase involved in cell wall biosynthesis
MTQSNNIIVVIPNNYKLIGGIRIPVEKYLESLSEIFEIRIILMDYRIIPSTESKKINDLIDHKTKSILVFSGVNQAIKMFFSLNTRYRKIRKIIYLADSPFFFLKSVLQENLFDIRNPLYLIILIMKTYFNYYKEIFVLRRFNDVIYISSVDYGFVKKIYKKINANISLIGHGTKMYNFQNKTLNPSKITFGILAPIDLLNYYMIFKPVVFGLLPLLNSNGNYFNILIVGKIKSKSIYNQIIGSPNIVHKEYLDNLDLFYSSIDASLTLIRKRNGILNRILESWSYGVITIGFNFNFAAFRATRNFENFLSGSSIKEIANNCSTFFQSKDLYNKLKINSFNYVKKNHDWNTIKSDFIKIILNE